MNESHRLHPADTDGLMMSFFWPTEVLQRWQLFISRLPPQHAVIVSTAEQI